MSANNRLDEHTDSKATYDLNNGQKANICLCSHELKLTPSRVDYMRFHKALFEYLRANKAHLEFEDVFGNPARETLLKTGCGHAARCCVTEPHAHSWSVNKKNRVSLEDGL
ncbi:hypothetical protein CONPUDRAFT_158433 [Coniophora puteana RWD-64-598 SS2]|uniref:Uncharacterized protein n=1 Tax=Coniophora puteana (strain RWD-64-598) TaxID=741705 RepID=A0A5M3MB06_CONPW|nr:uncharacterized protein CONPUDRAFT_158433 [Coniophora puteana RWD-64-598 SS2]EIW76409.1 hypothetical protein CONPUDRAFT_158433 [Coniophora puteana RWD-64-598 SS2]